MDYDPTIICDYITLWTKDGDLHPESDLSDGRIVWDIPPNAYYFKDRGYVCMMSIVDATVQRIFGENCVIMTQSGFNGSTAQIYGDVNQFEKDIQDLATLGNIVNAGGGASAIIAMTYQAPEPIRLLTPARPSKIKLYFVEEDKRMKNMTSDGASDNGHFTIKFEYIKPETLQENIYSVEYKPAF